MHYFNAGVIIINLSKWRKGDYTEKIIELISTHSYTHHDQDALNIVCKNDWIELPLRWNVIPPVYFLALRIVFSNRMRRQAIEAKRNPALVHWAGRKKPWHFKKYKKFNDIYYRYADAIPFYVQEDNLPDLKLHKRILLGVAEFLTQIFHNPSTHL